MIDSHEVKVLDCRGAETIETGWIDGGWLKVVIGGVEAMKVEEAIE
jgi:hypothetical protein